jgi:CheY-like chemotaxis protein
MPYHNQTPIRILVVDDEESNRTFAEMALRDAGYVVASAPNGPSALTAAEQEGPFDLFVLDVVMPQMRGDELGRRLAARDPATKVLYFTGDGDWVAAEGHALGAHEAVLEKPVTLRELLTAVSSLLAIQPT